MIVMQRKGMGYKCEECRAKKEKRKKKKEKKKKQQTTNKNESHYGRQL